MDITGTPHVRDELKAKTGEWTVPQVFVDGVYIGQDDELLEMLESGALDPPAIPAAPSPEGRFRRGFRLFIRWTAGLLLVFALGFLAATMILYLPKSREVVRAEDRLNQANTTIQEFEDQVEAVNLQLDLLVVLGGF